MKKKLPLLLALLALPLGSLPVLAVPDDAKALAQAQTELDALRQRYADQHPKVQEQKLRLEQLQQRFDVEARDVRKAEMDVRQAQPPIIRSRIKIRPAKEDAGAARKIIASPTFVTQAGQAAVVEASELSISLTSSADEQNNITSAITITRSAPDGSGLDVVKLPVIKSRPGEPASASIGDISVDLVAGLVEPKGIDVDFRGGTLGQLLASLNTAGSEPFNLVASQDILDLPLPGFKVRNVEPRDLAMTIDWLLDGYIVEIPADNPGRTGLPVFTVRVNNRTSQPREVEAPAKPELFKSYPISVLLNQFPVEEVITTLHSAWALDPSHRAEDLRIKYHAPTGILLISSREEAALKVVQILMESLAQEARNRPTRTP